MSSNNSKRRAGKIGNLTRTTPKTNTFSEVNLSNEFSTENVEPNEAPSVKQLKNAFDNPTKQTLTPGVTRALQHTHGNQTVQRLISQARISPATIQRAIIPLSNGEKLKVANGLTKDKQDELVKQAEDIIECLKTEYGIDLDSKASVKAMKKSYYGSLLKAVGGRRLYREAWELKELETLRDSLAHYAPLLGKNRDKANPIYANSEQGVKTMGKVKQALSDDGAGPYLENDTLGETFRESKNITAFKSLTNYDGDFPGENKLNIRQTLTHELTHGLIQEHHLDGFVKSFKDYWADEDTKQSRKKRAKSGAEAPITAYGTKNAAEDLCETAGFYFEAPAMLKSGKPKKNGKIPATGLPGNAAPRRFAWFEELVDNFSKLENFRRKATRLVTAPKAATTDKAVEQFLQASEVSKLYDLLDATEKKRMKDLKSQLDSFKETNMDIFMKI